MGDEVRARPFHQSRGEGRRERRIPPKPEPHSASDAREHSAEYEPEYEYESDDAAHGLRDIADGSDVAQKRGDYHFDAPETPQNAVIGEGGTADGRTAGREEAHHPPREEPARGGDVAQKEKGLHSRPRRELEVNGAPPRNPQNGKRSPPRALSREYAAAGSAGAANDGAAGAGSATDRTRQQSARACADVQREATQTQRRQRIDHGDV